MSAFWTPGTPPQVQVTAPTPLGVTPGAFMEAVMEDVRAVRENDPAARSAADADIIELRRHYYAAISWADFAAGQVLSELDALGLTNDTLVVAHGDHGPSRVCGTLL